MQVYFEYAVELHDPATGVNTLLPAGTPIELPQEEAMARIAAGGVKPVDVAAHEAAIVAGEQLAPPPAPESEHPNPPAPESTPEPEATPDPPEEA